MKAPPVQPTEGAADDLVSAIISMCKALRLRTVAEGVETEEQLNFLRDHGCDEYQGYFFSAPVPAEELPALVRGARKGATEG